MAVCHFSRLPTELLQRVVRFLPSTQDRTALQQSTRRLAVLAPAADPIEWIRSQVYTGNAVSVALAIIEAKAPSFWDPFLPLLRSLMSSAEYREHMDSLNRALVEYPTKAKPVRIQRLLTWGADVHTENDAALRLAAMRGHTESVAVLLERGANVYILDNAALRSVAAYGHTDAVQLLLDAGSNIHAMDDAALRDASGNGHIGVVKILLAAGADVHTRGDEPFRRAAQNGHIAVVALLLDRGSNLDPQGFYWAIANGKYDVVKLLLERGADVYTLRSYTLSDAEYNGHTEIVNLLKAYGAEFA